MDATLAAEIAKLDPHGTFGLLDELWSDVNASAPDPIPLTSARQAPPKRRLDARLRPLSPFARSAPGE